MAGSATSQASVRAAINDLRKYLRKVEKVPEKVMTVEAKRMLREAKIEAPRKTGRLERGIEVRISNAKTGTTILLSSSARSVQGEQYAGIQHENPYFKHRKGKYHYLLDPYTRGTARIKAKLKQELKPPGGKRK